ncbi:MAG: ABC transporter transmembrane domain-containing protein [Hydrogeniiclostridium mannosilyticum]
MTRPQRCATICLLKSSPFLPAGGCVHGGLFGVRLTSDTYNIHQMIGMMQRLGIRAPILLLGGMAMTLFLEPVLALVLLAALPFVGFVVFYISRKGIPLYSQLQRAVDSMVRVVRENTSGIRVVKALSKADYEKGRFTGVNRAVAARETKASVTMAASNPLMNFFLNLGLTLVVVAGAFRVYGGETKTGPFGLSDLFYHYFKRAAVY